MHEFVLSAPVRTANISKQTKLYIALLIYLGACKIT